MNIRAFHDQPSGTLSYLVDDGAGACAVIDPVMGFDAASGRRDPEPVKRLAGLIRAEALSLRWILETHAHADHLSGAPWLRARCGGCVAIGEHICQVQKIFGALFHATDLVADGSQFDQLFADGDVFSVGRLGVKVMHVPGHTQADVAYRFSDPADDKLCDAVFVGDTLLAPEAGTARCDFPGGQASVLFASVRRLLALPACTRLFVCHDYPETGGVARAMSTVAEHRMHNIHMQDGNSEAEFIALRQARDAALPMPRLMLPAVQVNMRAGHLPPAENDGTSYLRIPVDRL
jgi:glyoxylase-like metal-dependent hydrolase (beta-lactamase superfamily II)